MSSLTSAEPASRPRRDPAGRKRTIIICAGLAALTLVVFGTTLRHSYVIWGDQASVYENPHLAGKPDAGIGVFWSKLYEGRYVPVSYSVWSAIAALSGESVEPEISQTPVLDPAPFHAANLILHLACVFLVFRLLRVLLPGADPVAAGFGAALFAIHPLQVEPVAWVSGMKDVLSAFFSLGAAVIYLENSMHRRRPGKNPFTGSAYWAAFFLFIAALLSKPAVAMLPVVLLLLDGLLAKIPWKKTAVTLIPYFLAAAAVAITTTVMDLAPDQNAGQFPATDSLPFHLRPVAALDSLAFYLSKLAYPLRLAAQYDRSPERAVDIAAQFPLWAIPLLAALILLGARRSRNFIIAGFGSALLFLLPVLGFIPFKFLRISTVADHFMYLPMFGIALALAAWIAHSDRLAPRVAAGVAIAAFTVISIFQVSVWRTSTTLFTHTEKINPRSAVAASNLGAAAMRAGRYEEALVHYGRLLTLRKNDARAHSIVGYLHNEAGRFNEAIPYFQRAIELDRNLADAYRNLGISRFNLGEFDGAALLFQRAIELNPSAVDALVNLGATFSNLEKPDEAIAAFQRAAALDPTMWQPHRGMATIYLDAGRHAEAVSELESLVRLRPDHAESVSSLAAAYAATGQRQLAVNAAARAVQIAQNTPGFPAEKLRQYRDQLVRLQARRAP